MRGRCMAVWALSALSCVGFASVASAASHPQERRGFWIGVGTFKHNVVALTVGVTFH